jgi:hypothetical protein
MRLGLLLSFICASQGFAAESLYPHALVYPVEVTGLAIPLNAFENLLELGAANPFRKIVPGLDLAPFEGLEDFYQWLGLAPFSADFPRPAKLEAKHRVGAAVIRTAQGPGVSFSCATCHATEFFGKTVMGLPNKGSRANELFFLAGLGLQHLPSHAFQLASGASEQERRLYEQTRYNLQAVKGLKPLVLGLDTSLAHVSRSLAKRNKDAFASRSSYYEIFPRQTYLDTHRADSKPATWWTVKYKSRWLSDGSVVSGNPIVTNILWNEIGRGSDLRKLETWLGSNSEIIDEMMAEVLSTKAPRWTEFFPASSLDRTLAERGEQLFAQNCGSCHGTYVKDWESLETREVRYPFPTKVVDVGTDPRRYEGMRDLSGQLNALSISQSFKIRIEPQKGYVPPPLEGIWARYPYFHNNSAPNLCAVLSLPPDRPKTFVQGPAQNLATDFDEDCVGYPTGEKMPKAWLQRSDGFYDTRRVGLSNAGHSRMLMRDDGSEKFSAHDKRALLEFLKTL